MSLELIESLVKGLIIIGTSVCAVPFFYLAIKIFGANRTVYQINRVVSGSTRDVVSGRVGTRLAPSAHAFTSAGMEADLKRRKYRSLGKLSENQVDQILLRRKTRR